MNRVRRLLTILNDCAGRIEIYSSVENCVGIPVIAFQFTDNNYLRTALFVLTALHMF
jgi:hypothetical protein